MRRGLEDMAWAQANWLVSGRFWPKPASQVVNCLEAATDPKRKAKNRGQYVICFLTRIGWTLIVSPVLANLLPSDD
jgi:hypothetical protein